MCGRGGAECKRATKNRRHTLVTQSGYNAVSFGRDALQVPRIRTHRCRRNGKSFVPDAEATTREQMKRLGRYLKGRPCEQLTYNRQDRRGVRIKIYTDSDWVGNLKGKHSTSVMVIKTHRFGTRAPCKASLHSEMPKLSTSP